MRFRLIERILQPGGQERNSRRGSVAVIAAIVFVVLIGFVALGTEVAALLLASRQMQSAADSAALAAAVAKKAGYPVPFADDARALARAAGFVAGEAGTTVAVNNPPLSGPYAGQDDAIEVIITRQHALLLIRLFQASPWNLTGRAVATTGGGPGVCVLALDVSTSGSAIYGDNGGRMELVECGVGSNSSSSRSIRASGSAVIMATSLTTVGNYYTSGGGAITISGTIDIHAAATPDPFLDRVVPTPGSCRTVPPMPYNGLLQPGTYCSGVTITNGSHVTLDGLYILRTGNFSVEGGSTVTGTATIVLTGTGGGTNTGSVAISNGSIVNITALSSGPTAGMVFFQDRRARTTPTNSFIGGTTSTFAGALYFPRQIVDFSNGGSSSAACMQIVARRITIGGGSTVRSDCSGGTPGGGAGQPRLVE